MKKKAGNLVICIIFLAGLSLLLYPFVANQWNNYRQKQLISGYEQVVSEKEAAEGIDYDAERKKAEDYNEALLPCVLPDSFALAVTKRLIFIQIFCSRHSSRKYQHIRIREICFCKCTVRQHGDSM